MARRLGTSIILTKEEMRLFLEKFNNPDPEYIARRDKFFKELDLLEMREFPDGSFEFETDIDL